MSCLASLDYLEQYLGASLSTLAHMALACAILPHHAGVVLHCAVLGLSTAVAMVVCCCVCSLDTMLGGGLKETTVTEIAGETCSGKTQVSDTEAAQVQHCARTHAVLGGCGAILLWSVSAIHDLLGVSSIPSSALRVAAWWR